MVYDLTAVLTTIAAGSASIVAILGGFIASKLISISSEREETIKELEDIDKEISYRMEVTETLRSENIEEDALCFVLKYIEYVVMKHTVENVYYKCDTHPHITLDSLRPFWEKALAVCKQYETAKSDNDTINADNVPRSLAMSLRDDDFGYEVCKKIGGYFRKLDRMEERRKHPYDIASSIEYYEPTRITGDWYKTNEETIKEHETAVGLLRFQKEQLERTKSSLLKPKGMVSGLVVFALFSVFCIVLPLSFSPFETEIYNQYLIAKILFLAIFVVGLSGIFIYLVWLLKWNEVKKEKNDDNN